MRHRSLSSGVARTIALKLRSHLSLGRVDSPARPTGLSHLRCRRPFHDPPRRSRKGGNMARPRFHLLSAVLASGIVCVASSASAYVPGWAHWWRGTVVDLKGCAAQAAGAVQQATGSPATTLQLDKNTYLIR